MNIHTIRTSRCKRDMWLVSERSLVVTSHTHAVCLMHADGADHAKCIYPARSSLEGYQEIILTEILDK